jgi:hypothetical protein
MKKIILGLVFVAIFSMASCEKKAELKVEDGKFGTTHPAEVQSKNYKINGGVIP